jgi:glycosyltransferase involved in cell wall biosynthesis
MTSIPKIVVLTPVRNEAWILDRFLSVACQFADAVIVSDQGSTDGSRDIYKKFPKVHMIENRDLEYNEASRQRNLIEAARRLVPGPRILLALDSDEVMAADAPQSEGWRRMMDAKPGTVLYFEKPDLYGSPHRAIRYKDPWPLGYVDDGCEHDAKLIHSIRIPRPAYAQHLRLPDVKVLHYAFTRANAQKSKLRYYSVIENLHNTHRFYVRRTTYAPTRDFSIQGVVEPSPPEWFTRWQQVGIDMFSVSDDLYNWQDFEILKLFDTHGYRRFWLDDIWDLDWEQARNHALAKGLSGIPNFTIASPPAPLRAMLTILDAVYARHKARVSARTPSHIRAGGQEAS